MAVPEGSDSPNRLHLGDPAGRRSLSTPALILDIDAFEHNLALVVDACRRAGIAVRPHIKGHKCVEIARRQLAAGAAGLSCATPGEASIAVEAGASSILLTSPLITPAPTARVAALARSVPEMIVVVDHPAQVAAFSLAAEQARVKLRVLCDFDVGQKRTGCLSFDDSVAIAGRIAGCDSLEFAGIQAYYGHLQAIKDFNERERAARDQQRRIAACANALTRAGFVPRLVSGGGTGTLATDIANGPFTEIQPGSFVALDRQYAEAMAGDPSMTAKMRRALFVRGHVISCNQADRVTLNVGMKALATDSGLPDVAWPADINAQYAFAGDEHGFLLLPPPDRQRVGMGDAIELVPSHCDTTFNLHRWLHVVRGEKLEEIWPIAGRGVW